MKSPSTLSSSSSTRPLYNPASPRSSLRPFLCLLLSVFLILGSVTSAVLFVTVKHEKKHRSPTSAPGPPAPIAYQLPISEISSACKAARNSESCRSSISASGIVPSRPSPLDVILSAVAMCAKEIAAVEDNLETVISFSTNQNISRIAKLCLEFANYSQSRMSSVNESVQSGHVKNARAWLSASLSYAYDCSRGFQFYANDTSSINDTMAMLKTLQNDVASTLSMLVAYDLHGNDTTLWNPPLTERDGFWEIPNEGYETNVESGFLSSLAVDAIVCKEKTDGCYATVQEAVDAAPSNSSDERFVIRIKEGIYEEIVRVPFDKKNVVFVGDGMNKTVITGSRSVSQPGITTYDSATVGVMGDGFMATNITFMNTAGSAAHQAVAFRSDSDRSILYNCEFIGNQDTLYAHSLRQYYESCRIQGNIDFIFGNAAAVFQKCLIQVAIRREDTSQSNSVICASGRIHPAQSTGFVFRNCTINATNQNVGGDSRRAYLGRPWKEYARTVYMNSEVGGVISPEGWMPWDGDYALSTLYYGEFGNFGAGSNTSARVPWSGVIPVQNITAYSTQNFIQLNDWLPT